MPDRHLTGNGRPFMLILLLAAAVAPAGCASLGSFFTGENRVAGEAPSIAGNANAGDDTAFYGDVNDMLSMMEQLADGDEIVQAAWFSSAQAAVESSPTAHNRLKFALALSVPGHNGSDLAAAVDQLEALIASRQLLPRERMLATIRLQSVSDLLELRSAGTELDAALSDALAERDAKQAELTREQAKSAQLKDELQDATAKLDAITSIEQSISEREDDEN
jgi:hypothetical protein